MGAWSPSGTGVRSLSGGGAQRASRYRPKSTHGSPIMISVWVAHGMVSLFTIKVMVNYQMILVRSCPNKDWLWFHFSLDLSLYMSLCADCFWKYLSFAFSIDLIMITRVGGGGGYFDYAWLHRGGMGVKIAKMLIT